MTDYGTDVRSTSHSGLMSDIEILPLCADFVAEAGEDGIVAGANFLGYPKERFVAQTESAVKQGRVCVASLSAEITTVTWWLLPCHSRTNGSAARQQGRQNGLRGSIAAQSLVKQTMQLSGDRFTKATLAALLPRIGNGERENVPTERSWRMLPDLLGPERP
jgi:hypothetical protein